MMGTAVKRKPPEAPYGWEWAREGERYLLKPLATEIWVLRYIRQLKAFGCSAEDICQELFADGIAPRGGGRFTPEEIAALLVRDDTPLWERWRAHDSA
jgi:hypothetical protein